MDNGIPKHLKSYVVMVNEPKSLNDIFKVAASIKCSCGVDAFNIVTEKWEQSHESKEAEKQINALKERYKKNFPSNRWRMMDSGYKGRWWIFVEEKGNINNNKYLEDITDLWNVSLKDPLIPTYLSAICSKCSQQIVILDTRYHGYDAFAWQDTLKFNNNFKTKQKQKCRTCGNNNSKITVKISSTGKDDLLAEGDGIINEENWQDAFDWITIDLECAGCGKITKKYLDLETA